MGDRQVLVEERHDARTEQRVPGLQRGHHLRLQAIGVEGVFSPR